MGFEWPLVLLSLLVLPLLLGRYVRQLRRRRRRAVRYSSVALIRAAAPPRRAWRRHVAVRAAAGARSARSGWRRRARRSAPSVPVSESAMILALDVSGSMCATDVQPNRLTAAQAAVRDFVQAQDPEHEHRAGPVLRIRAGRGGPDDRPGAAAARHRLADHRAWHDHRRGHPQVGRRDRRDQSGGGAADPADPGTDGRPPTPPRHHGPPGSYRAGDRRAAHRRRNTRGIEPVEAAEIAAEPRGAGLPDRVRHPQPDVDGLHGGPAGRPGLRGSARTGAGRAGAAAAEASWSPTRRRCARWPTSPAASTSPATDAGRLQSVLADLPRSVETPAARVEVSVGAGRAGGRAAAGRACGRRPGGRAFPT